MFPRNPKPKRSEYEQLWEEIIETLRVASDWKSGMVEQMRAQDKFDRLRKKIESHPEYLAKDGK